jgi:hypothetical protein
VARGIFGNVSKTRSLPIIFVDCRLILEKNRGLFTKWHRIFDFKLFSNGKGVDSVPGSWTMGDAGPGWTADMALAATHQSLA